MPQTPATISSLRALEVLDSRGDPTLRVTATLSDGAAGSASVPAGASTGAHEAVELRDGERARYRGRGVRQAVETVEGAIAQALSRASASAQDRVDATLCDLDGTPSKSRLGANALLGTSLAVARAAAASSGLPLYGYLRRLAGKDPASPHVLPLPHLNLVNGGRHADSGLDVQEYLLLPLGAPTFPEAVRWGSEIFHALGDLLRAEGHATAVGDEGGYAPRLERDDEVFALLGRAVEGAGRALGADVAFGIDAAASEFFEPGREGGSYVLNAPRVTLTPERLTALYAEWMSRWPLRSVEDPLHEDDWEGWAKATEKLRALGAQVVGDDLFVTSVARLEKGADRQCGTAVLVKVNQVGTLTEALATIRLAQERGYGVVISHRSGETADTFIADLAVAVDAGQIKAGSLSRGERVEKYNRLLEIAQELGGKATYAGGSALRT